jgi:hypothetical protein
MNSVIHESPLSPQARARLGDSLRGLLRQRLPALLRALFDTLDDSLFELAEHAREPNRQRDFFDGMRECRRRRTEVEQTCLGLAERGVLGAFRDDLRTLGMDEADDIDEGDSGLSLVANEDLEEDLALQAMVSKAEGHLSQPLYALNQRVGFALEIPALGDSDNPLAPAALAEAFRRAARRLDIPMHVRLVVFKLFERHVLGALDPLYSEANILLAEAGVLPTLRARLREVKPASGRSAGGAGGGTGAGARGEARPRSVPEPDELASDDTQLLGRLIETIGSRRAVEALRNAASVAGAPEAATADASPFEVQSDARIPTATLQEALARLQQMADAPLPRAELKRRVLDDSHRLAGEAGAAMRPADENVVDLIGLLFEQLQADTRLPNPLQELISQLQVPVLRAALLDQNILADGLHPARRLIEEICSAATGWSPEADPGQRLLNRVRETVEWLRKSFDSDIGAFEQALRDFRAFNESQRRRAELAEQRATEAALGRERLLLARRRVSSELGQRLRAGPVPTWLGQLLSRPWANYMVLAWLRQGEDSPAYAEAARFAQELLALADAEPGAEENRRIGLRLSQLDACLRQGLATVAYHDSEIELLSLQLRAYVTACGGGTPEMAIDLGPSMAPALFDAAVDDLQEQPAPEVLETLAPTIALLQSEGTGRWFELRSDQGSTERAKLAWISPMSSRCLLVNRQGLKVAEKPLESLAADLERGVAQMLEGGLVVQKALEGILEQLTQQVAGNLLAG